MVCVKVYEANKGEAWKAGRDWCKYIKTEAVSEALVRFASSNPSAEKEYDGAFCKAVYGATLTELQKLKSWYFWIETLVQPLLYVYELLCFVELAGNGCLPSISSSIVTCFSRCVSISLDVCLKIGGYLVEPTGDGIFDVRLCSCNVVKVSTNCFM